MTSLIALYAHHQRPKGDPALIRKQAKINAKAEAALTRMQKQTAPATPATPLEDLHAMVCNKQVPWQQMAKALYKRYMANKLANWPLEVLQLLAETFLTEEQWKLAGKQAYNLFKSITAIMLHLHEPDPA